MPCRLNREEREARDHRCRYRGDTGMKRWVGLGVLGDNLINLGVVLARTKSKTE